MGFEDINLIVDGPREVGPINFCTGNWWVVNLEDLGVHHVSQNIGEQMEKDPKRVDVQSAWHGSNLPALAAMWEWSGIYKLKKGSSSTKDVHGVHCENTARRGSYSRYMTWFNSDCGPEHNLYSCILEMQVGRKRRAN